MWSLLHLSASLYLYQDSYPSNVMALHNVHVLILVKHIRVVWLSCWLGNCDQSAKLLMLSRLEFFKKSCFSMLCSLMYCEFVDVTDDL